MKRNSFFALLAVLAVAAAAYWLRTPTTPTDATQPSATMPPESDTQESDTLAGSSATESLAALKGDFINLDAAATMPAPTPVQLLRRSAYTVSYNSDTRLPNWVAWRLTAAHTRGDVPRPQAAFHEDTDVPRPRANFEDYRNTPWSRGHICPAGDNKWDADAMYETFLMTNICPQHKSFNAGEWNEIERLCRTWARRYGEVIIVSGPILADNPRRIGRARVAVPDAFFKAVLRLGSRPATIAFVCANDDSNQPWRSCAMTVDDLEHRLAIDLFPFLPDDVEAAIEATMSVRQW